MKTNYEFKSSIKNNKISPPLKVVFVIVILLIIFHLFLPKALPSFFLSLVKPFWSANIPDRNLLQPLSQLNQSLLISQFKIENEELKEFLGRANQEKSVLAYILKKPPFTAYDSFVLDIGKDKGIEVKDKVYAIGDILIGEIDEVYGETSRVKLYSSHGQKYEVLIGENSVQVNATGRGGGTFEAVIPRDIKVALGDKIIIPNISNSVFGIVGEVLVDPAKAFSTVIFSYPINIYEQKWVVVSYE